MRCPALCRAGLLLAAATAAPGHAQEVATRAQPTSGEAPADDAQELAKKLSNPVASLISVPFQGNWDVGSGVTGDGSKFTLNIQPVVPVSISTNANVIVRTIVPVIAQANIRGDHDTDFELGDVVQSFFYSPKKPTAGGIIWGVGPVFLYPTGTSQYTTGKKWGAGPTIVVLKQFGQTTVGFLGNHIWSVAGSNNRPAVSATFLQPFVAYTTKGATTYSLNTESTYDWKSKQWSVPINAAIAQLVRIGKQPVSIGFGGRYYVATPDFGPHWGVRVVTTLLYPKK